MATIGTEILSYQPRADLGLGANADIPAIYSDNNVINQTGRDIMLLNHENNVNLWKQKIADRDKQLELIDKGQVATGRVLDRDKPLLKGLETAADNSFNELVKSKPGTKEYETAYRNYQKNLTAYKDGVTVAQHNQLGVDQLNVDKSKETLAFKQKRIQDFLDNELKKPPGSPVGVYVPSLDYDSDKINDWGEGVITGTSGVEQTAPGATTISSGNINPVTGTTEKVSVTNIPGKPSKTVTTKTTAPLRGKQPQSVGEIVYKDGLPYSRTKQYVDFDKIRLNKITQYADESGEQYENQENHRKAYETAPDNIFEPVMNHIIQRVKDYNHDKGLNEGDKGYLNPQDIANKLGIDPTTGKRTGQRIMMSTPDFAALTALANYNGSYAPATDVLLKDQAELGIKMKESQAKIGAINALAAQRKASTRLTNKKASAIDNQFNPAQTFDTLFGGRMKTTQGNTLPSINVKDVPKAFLDNLGIDPVDDNGDYQVTPANIKFNGKTIPEEDVQKMYAKWLTTDGATEIKDKMGGKTPDIFDFMYANGANFEVEVIGKVKPEYTKDKSGKVTLSNPNQAGKITRSNRLQSWINQRKGLGVKGEKLIMEETNSETDNIDNQ